MGDGDAQRMMQYDAMKKSMLVAYLLWLVLGEFGVHRFYLGRTGSGLAMLVIALVSLPLTLVLVGFVGLAVIGIWWLVDAFLIPAIVQSHNLRLASAMG